MSKKVFLKGTLILACTGLVSRIAGFFYRIFLSHAIGAEGLGLYQLILPLQGLMAALSYTGIQSALSRLIASRLALQEKNPESTRDLRSSSADGCQYTTLRHSLLH